MKRLGAIGFLFPAVIVVVIAFMSAYTVETGNVSVERTLGKVNHVEQLQGLLTVFRLIVRNTPGAQDMRQNRSIGFIVIDDKYAQASQIVSKFVFIVR